MDKKLIDFDLTIALEQQDRVVTKSGRKASNIRQGTNSMGDCLLVDIAEFGKEIHYTMAGKFHNEMHACDSPFDLFLLAVPVVVTKYRNVPFAEVADHYVCHTHNTHEEAVKYKTFMDVAIEKIVYTDGIPETSIVHHYDKEA